MVSGFRHPLGITPNSHFVLDLGGDSLAMADLHWRLKKKTGEPLEPEGMPIDLTLRSWTRYYLALRKGNK
ncbi:acyl carrier protein [Eubacterium aggregans]|uniref:acyl carrier protein n=1 Tax=Eubacterium aggregans TaxID=81409 RepID=UPI003F3E31AE